MEDFSNSVLPPQNLPVIEKQTFNPLEKSYLKILFIRLVVFLLLITAGLLAFLFLSDENTPLFLKIIFSGVTFILILLSVVTTYLGFPRKGYLIRDHDITFQKGLLVYKVTSVPFNRIQHVEVSQGILAKKYKLSTIKIFTAGGSASDLSIPGLPEDVAQNLKAFLSEKISEHE